MRRYAVANRDGTARKRFRRIPSAHCRRLASRSGWTTCAAVLFTSGEFRRLIAEDGLRGATSNPSIFEKAIAGSTDYLDALQDIESTPRYGADGAVRGARDSRHPRCRRPASPVYDSTGRADGYVSLEVSPYLAHDTEATIDEARRLWKAVARENVMIKVPASIEGLPAIRQLTSEGINVNITLLFGIERYEAVARAYMEGLSAFVRNGGDPGACVQRGQLLRQPHRHDGRWTDCRPDWLPPLDPSLRTSLTSLLGTVAIANAKLAYQRYLALCRTRRVAAARWPGEHIRNVSSGQAPVPRIRAIATCATLKS